MGGRNTSEDFYFLTPGLPTSAGNPAHFRDVTRDFRPVASVVEVTMETGLVVTVTMETGSVVKVTMETRSVVKMTMETGSVVKETMETRCMVKGTIETNFSLREVGE